MANEINLQQLQSQLETYPLFAEVHSDRSGLASTRPGRRLADESFLPDFKDGQALVLRLGDDGRNRLVAITYENKRLNCFDTLVIMTVDEIAALNYPYVTEYDNGGEERFRQETKANSFITGIAEAEEKLFFMVASTQEELEGNLNAIIAYKQKTEGKLQFFGKL